MVWKERFWIIIIALLIGAVLGWMLKPEKYTPGVPSHSIDTTYITVHEPPESASGTGIIKWKIRKDTTFIYIKDSLLFARVFEGDNVYWDSIPLAETTQYILSKPFESSRTDTVRKDTLKYGFHFPENYLWSNVSFGPDSIMTIHDSVTVPVEIKEDWYVKPAYITGSVLLGVLLGLIVK